jgi:hypothetical protein
MAPSKLGKLRKRLNSLEGRGSVKSAEIEALAVALGRVRHKRGSEPTWVNESYPHLRPVSIPHHTRDLNRFTARAILRQLEEDLAALEAEADLRGEE